ncbi:methyl-accepting chemotaxis protein [Paraburkholderia phenazinium]|uniref:Methyl-accepting chemotaxis sensory transducer n=1 Tax=Paraburkholderia phenazinium TaxID=60549 RepID=A0A1G7RME0_9BURK|nr:methyl-accepting chemotaxis protein [Paraburkholderia phenazinium]SDG11260.1 methyl-accepting chemotaxis sensory transducer [Paraburkholderia phenazinium]
MNKLTNTIKFKIILALGACIVLMIGIGLMGVRGLATLSSDMSSMYTDSTVPIEDLAATQANALKIRLTLSRLLTIHDPAEAKQASDRIRDLQKKLNSAWTDYYPAKVSADDERKIADQIATQFVDFKSLTDTALAAIDSGNIDAAAPSLNKMRDVGNALSDTVDRDIDINATQVKQMADQGTDTYHALLWVSIGAIVLGLCVAIGASVYLMRAIITPLGSAVDVAQRIAEGQLENPLTIHSKDEFGDLLGALKQMDTQLADIVRGIKTSSESIMVASSEIAAGNMDLSSRTEEQAASLEETAASMEQLTATVKQNSENARQATTLAGNASDVADKGNAVVERMLVTMGDITASSSKIADITTLIEGIAFQTNILALNAAVEAARAGEQGRGFAVVAGEVRSLAQRSSSAAKEIKDLIQSSVATIHNGSSQAEEVGRTMAEVQQAIKRVADINAEISAASDEQSRGIEQVNQAVGQMDEVTQQNAALVEEASAAAQSLEQQAAQQKRAVSVFKVSESKSAAAAPRAVATAARARAPLARPVAKRTPTVAAKPAVALAEAGGSESWETF